MNRRRPWSNSKRLLKKKPGPFRSLYGVAHAAQLSGRRETSQKYFRERRFVIAAIKSGSAELVEAQRASSQNQADAGSFFFPKLKKTPTPTSEESSR
jgi:hypothetical protein